MNYDRNDQQHDDEVNAGAPGGSGSGGADDRDARHRPQPAGSEEAATANRFGNCALIAEAVDWADELASLGVHRFKRPEALYKAIRNRTLDPDACIVDLDAVPRKLVRAVDIRVPCPKLWLGGSAPDPADIKYPGVYHARARPDEIHNVIERLVEVDRATLLPAGIVGKQMFPFLVADKAYRERVQRYTEELASTNLITLHGEDPLELQLVAQTLAVETQRERIWDVKSEASIQSILRKIAQARRPGSDVTIILSPDIDVDSARDFYKAMPPEYAMIKLSAREENPVGAVSFTTPRPAQRPADIEAWSAWFICRATVEQGIALSGLEEMLGSVLEALGDNPGIEDIKSLCERSVRQHATLMEDRGEFRSYDDLVRNYERAILRRALTQQDGNLSATARSLGLAESSLRYKLKALGINRGGASE